MVAGGLAVVVLVLGVLVATKKPPVPSGEVVAAAPVETKPAATAPAPVVPAPVPANPTAATPAETKAEPAGTTPATTAGDKPDTKILSPEPSPSQVPKAAPPGAEGKDGSRKTAETLKAEGSKAADAKNGEGKAPADTTKPGVIPATVFLSVTPWGEVFVNGKSQGVSPPTQVHQARSGQVQDRDPQHHLPRPRREPRAQGARRGHVASQIPMTRLLRALPFALLIFVAACADMKSKPEETAPPAPAAPQITEDMLRARANEQLATGVKLYEAGEFDSASRSFNASLEHGLLPKVDQARARKYLAFIYCVLGREAQCRDEFRKAFEIYPEFALTAAEDGHPIWGPVYRSVRTQLITEREANQQQRTAGLMAGKASCSCAMA